ncbi:sulfite exporter TauE/SafE family protein [Oscillatoria sp. FACHB-1406]|uniref:urease accessory protein UreH domain-containing protein n=1 Tax=Oscillatoria sp. FACHB-1406 TaxID=2692846 RepID=UPI0016867F5B|nr:sulfite exporter TauE/SafE family protein [Oscillatoria sp. FACHB-1406]
MLDLSLLVALGFLGSFGHCVGMCGPLAVAFSLSNETSQSSNGLQNLRFHLLLNSSRLLSYAVVGAILGGVSGAIATGGQLAGVGSSFRQGIAILTGLMLIWFALVQLAPNFLPRLPFLHPGRGLWHQGLGGMLTGLSGGQQWWTPAVLGALWGLMPCGFLYAAQIKAAATGSWFLGALTMLGFGLGTLPTMVGAGLSASHFSAARRSQLFRLGGWITLAIGCLTLFRSDVMLDYTGHAALLLLALALSARPIAGFWAAPLRYRRAIGVGAFILAAAHTGQMMEHSLNWNFEAIAFLLPEHRWALLSGAIALLLLTPLALTSFDYWQRILGRYWRRLHLLAVPAFLLAALHTVFFGSSYWGALDGGWQNSLHAYSLGAIALLILALRSPLVWSLFSLARFYRKPGN